MVKNVGSAERVGRVLAGLGIVAWGVMAQNWWGAVGIVPILTGATGWCPPYHLLGISTCKTKTS